MSRREELIGSITGAPVIDYHAKKSEFFRNYQPYKEVFGMCFFSSLISILIIGAILFRVIQDETAAGFVFFTCAGIGLIIALVSVSSNSKRAYWATVLAYQDFSLYNSALQQKEINAIKSQNEMAAFDVVYANARRANPDGYPIKDGVAFRGEINGMSRLLNNQCQAQFERINRTNYVDPNLIELVKDILKETNYDLCLCARELYDLNEANNRRIY